MMKCLSLLFFTLYSLSAAANFQSEMLKGKKGKGGGANVQWTLADWLTQKNKASVMDQWLKLHSGSDWFEFNVSGTAQQYKLKSDNGTLVTSTDQTAQVYTTDIYLSLINLNGE